MRTGKNVSGTWLKSLDGSSYLENLHFEFRNFEGTYILISLRNKKFLPMVSSFLFLNQNPVKFYHLES